MGKAETARAIEPFCMLWRVPACPDDAAIPPAICR
jgi:hypothetical protein